MYRRPSYSYTSYPTFCLKVGFRNSKLIFEFVPILSAEKQSYIFENKTTFMYKNSYFKLFPPPEKKKREKSWK